MTIITADQLRQIHEGAPKTTPSTVREAISSAADELDRWHHFAANAAMTLEHAANLRIGQMDSHSRVDDVHAQIRNALVSVAQQCREML